MGKPLVFFSILLGIFGFCQDDVKVHASVGKEAKPFVFVVEDLIEREGQLPAIQVKFARILLVNGNFVREIQMSGRDRTQIRFFMGEKFRLYRGNGQLGIYKYKVLKGRQKPKKKGIYLEAIPIDNDETVSQIIAKEKGDTDLTNLLEMDLDLVMEATEREAKVDEALKKAQDKELTLLKEAFTEQTLFMVAVQAAK